MQIWGFEWDDTNLEKLALHDLTAEDIEGLFEHGDPYVFRHPTRVDRWIALGFASDDRFVLVAFEHDIETNWIRTVTAYESDSERYWRLYEKKKTTPPRA